MKSIITISREYGAGGGQIGRAVANELGYYYMDRDLILQTALQSGTLSPEEVRRYDEAVPYEFGLGQSLFDFYTRPLNERLFQAQRDAILKAGEQGKVVIVGRNANVILKEFDRSLHVFVSATPYFRLEHLKETVLKGKDDEYVLNEMRRIDKARKRYCSYYTDTEYGNAEYYDMCLKSSTLGIDKCVEMILDIARQ